MVWYEPTSHDAAARGLVASMGRRDLANLKAQGPGGTELSEGEDSADGPVSSASEGQMRSS